MSSLGCDLQGRELSLFLITPFTGEEQQDFRIPRRTWKQQASYPKGSGEEHTRTRRLWQVLQLLY